MQNKAKRNHPDDTLYRTQNVREKEAVSAGEEGAGDSSPAARPPPGSHSASPHPTSEVNIVGL